MSRTSSDLRFANERIAHTSVERVLHLPRHVPDDIAFDEDGRLWISCHHPDAICVFDPQYCVARPSPIN